MILVSFPSGGRVDDVINNQTNYQFTSITVIHFMNGAGVCWIIRRTVFNAYISLSNSYDISRTKLKGVKENQNIKREFFQNLDNFYI